MAPFAAQLSQYIRVRIFYSLQEANSSILNTKTGVSWMFDAGDIIADGSAKEMKEKYLKNDI